MSCYTCTHCNKCGMFSIKVVVVCKSCGTEVPAGAGACPACGGTSLAQKVVKPAAATSADKAPRPHR